jgi:hypothetical protein
MSTLKTIHHAIWLRSAEADFGLELALAGTVQDGRPVPSVLDWKNHQPRHLAGKPLASIPRSRE